MSIISPSIPTLCKISYHTDIYTINWWICFSYISYFNSNKMPIGTIAWGL